MNDETLEEQVRHLINTMNIVLSRLEDLEGLPTNAAELEETFGDPDGDDDDWDDEWDDEDDIDDEEEDEE